MSRTDRKRAHYRVIADREEFIYDMTANSTTDAVDAYRFFCDEVDGPDFSWHMEPREGEGVTYSWLDSRRQPMIQVQITVPFTHAVVQFNLNEPASRGVTNPEDGIYDVQKDWHGRYRGAKGAAVFDRACKDSGVDPEEMRARISGAQELARKTPQELTAEKRERDNVRANADLVRQLTTAGLIGGNVHQGAQGDELLRSLAQELKALRSELDTLKSAGGRPKR